VTQVNKVIFLYKSRPYAQLRWDSWPRSDLCKCSSRKQCVPILWTCCLHWSDILAFSSSLRTSPSTLLRSVTSPRISRSRSQRTTRCGSRSSVCASTLAKSYVPLQCYSHPKTYAMWLCFSLVWRGLDQGGLPRRPLSNLTRTSRITTANNRQANLLKDCHVPYATSRHCKCTPILLSSKTSLSPKILGRQKNSGSVCLSHFIVVIGKRKQGGD
jgi:hypothetical protein